MVCPQEGHSLERLQLSKDQKKDALLISSQWHRLTFQACLCSVVLGNHFTKSVTSFQLRSEGLILATQV